MIIKLLLIACLSISAEGSERPRGVSAAKASFYQAGGEFTCLDSKEIIPWNFVNDDYCDCKDGTDEPGTAACSNGVFFCENQGHRGMYLTSSKVNDGVCDCCDGSDEYEQRIQCVNQCDEMGRKEREEREKFRLLQEQGYGVKQEYIQQGKRTKDEKRARLSELERQMTDLKVAREELQKKKDEVEVPEKEAKERHEKAWEELKAQHNAEHDQQKAAVVFAELDVNSDNVVDYVELQKHTEFDIDSDGTVSLEEAKEYLDDNEGVDLETFQTKIYTNIKDIYKPLTPDGQAHTDQPLPDATVTPPSGPEDTVSSPDSSDTENEEDDYDKEDEEEEDEEDRGEEQAKPEKKEEEEEEKMPPYDADTQKLIENADAVRGEYNEADTKVRDAENEVNGLKKYLDVDYGPDEEYSFLRGQCFEYTDREYTYRLCPFDRAVQKPKSGGIETSLGNWGHWYGPEEDKYDAMKYENGQNCWNGPNRSCHVNLHCGTENKLTGASEPSRCEYQFEFTTPARCKQAQDTPTGHPHEEL